MCACVCVQRTTTTDYVKMGPNDEKEKEIESATFSTKKKSVTKRTLSASLGTQRKFLFYYLWQKERKLYGRKQ